MESNELANFYGDEDVVDEAPVEESTEAAETSDTEVKDEKPAEGESDKTEDKPETDPPSGSDDTKVPLAALTGERDKRQAAQREAEEYRKKLEALESKKEPVSVLEDEKGFVDQLTGDIDSRIINERLNMSQALAVREFGKEAVEKAAEWFKEAAANSPLLADRFRNAPLQYHEVVDMYNEHIELEKMKDLPSYKEQIRAEVEAEVKAKLEAELKEKRELRDSIPTSLAGEPSKGGLKGTEWKGPTPDEEIYGD